MPRISRSTQLKSTNLFFPLFLIISFFLPINYAALQRSFHKSVKIAFQKRRKHLRVKITLKIP